MLLRFQGLISSNWRCSFISVLHFDDENEIVMVGFLYHDHPLGMICMANAGEHAYGRVGAVWTRHHTTSDGIVACSSSLATSLFASRQILRESIARKQVKKKLVIILLRVGAVWTRHHTTSDGIVACSSSLATSLFASRQILRDSISRKQVKKKKLNW